MDNLFELGSIMIHPAKKQHPYYVKTTRLPSSDTLLNSQVWFGGKNCKSGDFRTIYVPQFLFMFFMCLKNHSRHEPLTNHSSTICQFWQWPIHGYCQFIDSATSSQLPDSRRFSPFAQSSPCLSYLSCLSCLSLAGRWF